MKNILTTNVANIFIFPNAVYNNNNKVDYKLNINQNNLIYIFNKQKIQIDLSHLHNGSSTMVLRNPQNNDLYVLYHFREMLQLVNLTPKAFLIEYNRQGLIQIEKSQIGLFIKVFLLHGDNTLCSDINDFSIYPHLPLSAMTELDRDYSWRIENISFVKKEQNIEISLTIEISDFWTEPLYISHAGQYTLLNNGFNKVTFHYIDTEDAYIGIRNCHYPGRKINLHDNTALS